MSKQHLIDQGHDPNHMALREGYTTFVRKVQGASQPTTSNRICL